MTTLYVMCGLPFAGKSTLVKELIKRFDFSLVASDEINSERGIGLHGEAIPMQEWDKTYDVVYKRLMQLLSQGKTVIYDDCNFTKKQRDIAKDIAQTQQAQTRVIYVNTSKEEVTKRWQQNRITSHRFDIRDEDFAQVVDNFQAPTQDEGVIIYNCSFPLEKWAELYLL